MKYIKILTFCFLLACLGFYVVSAKDIDRIGQKLFQKEPEENKQLENDELNIDVNSRYAILVEQDSGRVLYTKQAKKTDTSSFSDKNNDCVSRITIHHR